MKGVLLAMILIALGCSTAHAQISVNTLPPIPAITNVLRGPGVEVSNISFQGNAFQQLGSFVDSSQTTGFANGMVMCTGSLSSVTTANLSDSISMSGVNGLGDINEPDIDLLCSGAPNEDQIVVEFDVKVSGDRLFLSFVFASDEYPEKVCSSLSDVMGITISGPGFSGPFNLGAELISTVPNSNLPIGINSINNGTAGIFSDGSCTSAGLSNTNLYNTNTGFETEMDGYTDVITIDRPVLCDSTYHLKLMLADVGDFRSESAIFFKAGSLFTSGIHPRLESMYNDSSIVEGCKPFSIEFRRPAGGFADAIDFTLSGTAVNGTDYTTINSPVSFGNGDSTVTLTIEAIDDGINEGPESVVLSYSYVNTCGDTVFIEETFWILDPPSPKLSATYQNSYTYCEGDQLTLSATVSGGLPGYNIFWGGIQGNNISYNPGRDTTILLEISDSAACAIFDLINIDYVENPNISAGPDITICKNETAVLQSLSDGSGNLVEWSPDIFLNNSGLVQPTVINPTLDQTYTMTVTTPEGCSSSDQMTVTTLTIPYVDANGGGTILYQQETTEVYGTTSAPDFAWIPENVVDCSTCTNTDAYPDVDTWIYLIGIGTNGCRNVDSVFVQVDVPKDVFVPESFSPNGDGYNDVLYVRGYTIETLIFRVFDKWGNEVFSTNDRFYGWDGSISGSDSAAGLYTYTLQVNFVNNEGSAGYAGEINLVR